MKNQPGTLYLVAAPLDFGCDVQAPLQSALPMATLQVAARLPHWICENAKSTRAYLNRVAEIVPLAQPLQSIAIEELPREVHKKGDHTTNYDARPLLAAALQGYDMGLVSEAGMPAIADPGSSVVRAAHELDIPVVALGGPVSLMLALASSGLNGQNFAFVGYLPQDAGGRTARIRELETLALKTGQSQLFIEVPYRNNTLFQALLQSLAGPTRLSLSLGLTLEAGWSRSMAVSQWRQKIVTAPMNLPCVFGIGR